MKPIYKTYGYDDYCERHFYIYDTIHKNGNVWEDEENVFVYYFDDKENDKPSQESRSWRRFDQSNLTHYNIKYRILMSQACYDYLL